MSGYTKLFPSLVHSTIWREPNEVRLVWITMLALADRDGVVSASVPGLADAARVSITECERALAVLGAPDKYSRTPKEEGRRILPVDGGWIIVNHDKYRAMATSESAREKAAARQRRYRDRNATSRAVTPVTQNNAIAEAEAEAEAEADPNPSDLGARARGAAPPKARVRGIALPEGWQPNETHQAIARENGLLLAAEAASFRDYCAANGRAYRDHDAAFRNWLRNGHRFKRNGQEKPPGLIAHEQNQPLSKRAEAELERARRWRAEQEAKRGVG